jgi:hypothetical protein
VHSFPEEPVEKLELDQAGEVADMVVRQCLSDHWRSIGSPAVAPRARTRADSRFGRLRRRAGRSSRARMAPEAHLGCDTVDSFSFLR